MKAMFLGSDERDIGVFMMALRMRWPDSTISVVKEFEEGLDALRMESPDVVLMHSVSNGINFNTIIEQIRRCSNVPLVVLGNGRDSMELVHSLELGADNYMKPPYVVAEIMARIWALLRRSITYDGRGRTLRSGHLVINLLTHEVFLEDLPVMVTHKEFRLLHLVVKNHGAVVTHTMLQQALWGERVAQGPKLVKRYMYRLRRKLKDDARQPSWIATVRGEGYQFIGPIPIGREPEGELLEYPEPLLPQN